MKNTFYLNVLLTIMVSPNRKRKALILETKYEIIQSVQKGDSPNKDIAIKFVIQPYTLSTVLKKQGVNCCFLLNSTSSTSRKRNCSSSQVNVENAFLEWFKEKRNQNIPLNSQILLSKVEDLGQKLSTYIKVHQCTYMI